jgi:hypothetical protein
MTTQAAARLDRSHHKTIRGQAYKSCPKCSVRAGRLIFHKLEAFGERVSNGETYHQSWCYDCRRGKGEDNAED